MKITFISTLFNEESTVDLFLNSLLKQSKLPHEVILVDGGSKDNTILKLKQFKVLFTRKKVSFLVLTKKGNRSVGRNEAIKHAKGDVIVCSDFGNILDVHWIKNIVAPFKNNNVNVVAGYYKGLAKNVFQKCLIPYVLVMQDKVNEKSFLPATRSIAFTKKIWKKIGGFPEEFSHNEDYVFANKLKSNGIKIYFAREAIVQWIPRNTVKQSFIMFARFAFGDAESGIWRSKVLLLFARYLLGLYFIFLLLLYRSVLGTISFFSLFFFYLLYSIFKNYKYVKKTQAFLYLPVLQLISDCAVLIGTIGGIYKRINIKLFVIQNTFLIVLLFVYLLIVFSTLHHGIPNNAHPYPYNMDEWHQFHAVGTTFKFGTPNMLGSANGTMFHFVSTGMYLIPFVILKIVSFSGFAVDTFQLRERMFEFLRFNTILWGMAAIFTLYKTVKLMNGSQKLAIFLYTISPLFLMLSGYFKYDISLQFWIILSLYCILRFAQFPTMQRFIIAALPVGMAFSVKFSAIALFLVYFISFFFFMPKWFKQKRTLITGLGVVGFVSLIFGMPDTLFGKGNILVYLYENLVEMPGETFNYNLGQNYVVYLYSHLYPIMLGNGIYILFIISLLFMFAFLKKPARYHLNKTFWFLIITLIIFIISLLALKMSAIGSRVMVLLPIIILIISYIDNSLRKLPSKITNLYLVLFAFLVFFQCIETANWIYLKLSPTPQQKATVWIEKNIPFGQVIGIENIPIYQMLPEIIEKEFYYSEAKINYPYKYRYQIVDANTKNLPKYIVVTNKDIFVNYFFTSAKKDLILTLDSKGYKVATVIYPQKTMLKSYIGNFDFFIGSLIPITQDITIYSKK